MLLADVVAEITMRNSLLLKEQSVVSPLQPAYLVCELINHTVKHKTALLQTMKWF
jgi:hypothetical protein